MLIGKSDVCLCHTERPVQGKAEKPKRVFSEEGCREGYVRVQPTQEEEAEA